MKTAKLGAQGLHTSQLGLGCMGMSDFYGSFNDEESIRVIHRAIDLGITFLDTADMYGPYKNEELVGKSIKGSNVYTMANAMTIETRLINVDSAMN